MMKMQMLVLTPLLAAILVGAQAERPTSGPLARAFAEWKLAAATTASGPESLSTLRALRVRVADSEEGETLTDLAVEIDARLAALAPRDAQEPARPVAKRAEEVVIAEAVVTAVQTGDMALLEQLGARAVPALSGLAVQADGTTIPQGRLNPLESLFRLDLAAGLDAALELMESGDVLKKSFAAATLESNRKLNWHAAWQPVGATDWALGNESWNRIVPAALAEPALPIQNLRESIGALVARGQLPPELEDAVFESLRQVPPVDVLPEAGRGFFVRLLSHRFWSVRLQAVIVLQRSPDVEATYRLAGDPDVQVRNQVVTALREHSVREYDDRVGNAPRETRRPTEITDAYRSAVARLSGDEIDTIRWNTVQAATENALQQEKLLFSAQDLRELFNRIERLELLSISVRQVRNLPTNERVSLILAALDRARTLVDQGVPLEYELRAFVDLEQLGLSTGDEFWAIVDGITERGLVTSKILDTIRDGASNLILAGETDGDRYIGWAVRHGGAVSWNHATAWDPDTTERRLGPWLQAASSAGRGLAIRELAKHQTEDLSKLSEGRLAMTASDLLALARDVTAEPQARQWAAYEFVVQHPDTLDREGIDALVEAHAASNASQVYELMVRLEGLGRDSEFLRGLIAAPRTDEALIHRLIIRDLEVATADVVLERFPPETWGGIEESRTISEAVRTLVAAGDPRLEFANVRGSRLQNTLAQAIGESRAPALLPVLDRVLANARPGSTAWNSAVQAATGYFSDDAAALLLRSAREATTSEARQHAMDALKQMTDWREASAAWERSAGAAAKREVAIEELVALSEDDAQPVEIRAEALRGLGLLDAAEELPRLVRALTSNEAPIAAAARAALDRLNAKD